MFKSLGVVVAGVLLISGCSGGYSSGSSDSYSSDSESALVKSPGVSAAVVDDYVVVEGDYAVDEYDDGYGDDGYDDGYGDGYGDDGYGDAEFSLSNLFAAPADLDAELLAAATVSELDFPLTVSEASCLVSEIQSDEMVQAAVWGDNATPDGEATVLLPLVLACAGDTFAEMLTIGLVEDGTATATQASCVADRLLDGNSDLMASLVNEDPEAFIGFMSLMLDCGINFFGEDEPFEEPTDGYTSTPSSSVESVDAVTG